MRRRDFMGLSGAAMLSWLPGARAQQVPVPLIGFLDGPPAASRANRLLGLRQGLLEAGFVEGRDVRIEQHFAEGRLGRLPDMAADLVRRQVAVIVVSGPAMAAAKAATSTIPIVFITGGDPVESGYVTNLSRPSGNVTGVSFYATPLDLKRLELLSELVPKPALIGVLTDPNNLQSEAHVPDIEAAARALGRQVVVVKAASEHEIEAAFGTIVHASCGAVFVGTGPFYFSRYRQLVALSAHHALPASYGWRQPVEAGGLISYSASDTDACRRAGLYVGRILRGAKPADLPVELPTKYELLINLKTAKTLNLDIPPKLRAIADEVIE